nr:hypothetical protein [Tanacetum cinerariifolium]
MTSFDYRLNPLYPIKECSSCGALYTTDYCYSEGSLMDKIICDLNKTPDLSQRPLQNCPKCGNPVDGHYCQGCAILRKKFKEDLFTYCIENGIFHDFHDTFEPSNDNTNVANALQEPFVVKQNPSENSSQSAHYGYNCPPKVLIISDPKPCHNQTVDELPQTLPSFDPTCYSRDRNSFTYDSKSNLVDDSPNIFNPPMQPPTFSYEFCGNDAYYGHDCSLQVLFTYNPEPDDDDEDYTTAIIPILSTEEPDNSLSMGDEHLDIIPVTESDELIKSSVENLVPIPSESEGGIDDDILLTIKDDILREKLLNINLLIANIEALKDNPTPSFVFMTKSSSTSLNFLLEETNTFDNSLPESETFCFDLEEISSGSTTTHSDCSLYDSFIFDLSINPFPPVGRSDFYEFTDELTHIISPPQYDFFCFKNEPNSGDFTMDVVEDIFPTREPRVHNALPTHPTLQLNLDFILFSESLFAYVKPAFLLLWFCMSIIPGNLKTHDKGFCPPVFISSASLGNHVSKSNRANVYLLAYLINGFRFT